MATDNYYSKVTSLLPFDEYDPAQQDPQLAYLIASAELKNSIQSTHPPVSDDIVTNGTVKTSHTIGGRVGTNIAASSRWTYIHASNPSKGATQTIEFDAYIPTITTSTGIFSTSTSTSYGSTIQIYYTTSGIFFTYYNNSWMSSTLKPTADAWHRFTISYDGVTTARLFIDGILLFTKLVDNTISPVDNYYLLGVGGGYYPVATYGNTYSNLRIYRGAPAIINNFTPSDYTFNHISCFDRVDGNIWTRYGSPVLSTTVTKSPYRSLYLNGSSGICKDGTSVGSGNFTAELWFYLDSITTLSTILAVGYSSDSNLDGGMSVAITPEGYLVLYSYLSAYTADNIYTNHVVTIKQWHHIALQRTGIYYSVLLDGQVITTADSTSAPAAMELWIGSARGTSNLKGYVEDFRLTQGVARYPVTMVDEHANMIILYDSFNRMSGTYLLNFRNHYKSATNVGSLAYGELSVNPFGVVDYTLRLPAKSTISYANSTDFLIGVGNFTIELWVRLNGAKDVRGVIKYGYTGTNDGSYGVSIFYGYPKFFCGSPTLGDISVTSGSPVDINTWFHLAVCREGGYLRMYVNGMKTAESTSYSNLDMAPDLTPFVIGQLYTDYLEGNIADFLFTKYAKYTGESFPCPTSYYKAVTGSYTPPDSPLPYTQASIKGVVKDRNGVGVSRKILAYSHDHGYLVGKTESSAVDGSFTIMADEKLFCVCQDPTGVEEPMIIDNLYPV